MWTVENYESHNIVYETSAVKRSMTARSMTVVLGRHILPHEITMGPSGLAPAVGQMAMATDQTLVFKRSCSRA